MLIYVLDIEFTVQNPTAIEIVLDSDVSSFGKAGETVTIQLNEVTGFVSIGANSTQATQHMEIYVGEHVLNVQMGNEDVVATLEALEAISPDRRCTRCGKLQRDGDLDKSDNTCESHIRSLYCEGLRQTDDDAGSKP